MKKPRTIPEYIRWAKNILSVDFKDVRNERLYNVNIDTAYNFVSSHRFFVELPTLLEQWSFNYERRTKSHLLMSNTKFELVKKSYLSAIDKSFRKNVLWNKKYPKHPEMGWVTPENLFKYFNDGIRGTMVCKFIDGPSFLIKKLSGWAKYCNIKSTWYTQEKDEGYYAYHFYTTFEVDLLDINWLTQKAEIEVEIQITTQLQEVLRNLTHQFYEQRRISPIEHNTGWKWNYKSSQFRASYLSHSLHLLEAYIVQARDDDSKSNKR